MSFDAVARGAGADGVTIDLPLSDDRPARQDTDTDGEGSGPGTLSGSSRLDSIDNTSVTDVHEAQDDWNAFIMQTTVGSAFAHIDAPHVVSPDIWRHSRWQRMGGAVLMIFLCIVSFVQAAATSGDHVLPTVLVHLVVDALVAILLMPALTAYRNPQPSPFVLRWYPYMEACAVFWFWISVVAIKPVLVCRHDVTLCAILKGSNGAIPGWFGAVHASLSFVIPTLMFMRPALVIASYVPALVLSIASLGTAVDTSALYTMSIVLMGEVVAVAIIQASVTSSVVRALLSERRVAEQHDKLVQVVHDKAKAQNRAHDHKRERVALVAKQKAQQKLMGFVCHELRAPLHALKGIISSMDKDSLPEDILCDLEFMDVSAQQMSLIINDVLDLVTVQAGHQMAITPAWCDLRTAVKHARMFVDSYVQVPIVMVVHDDVPRQVWLDQLRFKQILLNGLSNACKLTTTGEITITVSLHAHARVRVDVCDTGPGLVGITEDQLFAPFTQGAKNNTASDAFTRGLGLGLPVCKDLVTTMGGEIHLQNRNDGIRGARFWFEVPCLPDNIDGSDSDDANAVLAPKSADDIETPRFHKSLARSHSFGPSSARERTRASSNPSNHTPTQAGAGVGAGSGAAAAGGANDRARASALRHMYQRRSHSTAVPSSQAHRHTLSVGRPAVPMSLRAKSRARRQVGASALGQHHGAPAPLSPSAGGIAATASAPSALSRGAAQGVVGAGSGAVAPLVSMQEESVEPAATARPRVLAVDDDRVSRKLMQRYLKRLKIDGTVIAEGGDAVSILEAAVDDGKPFSVVLLDVMMSGMDGKQVCQAIRAANLHLPVVATTGTTDVGCLRELVEEAGFTAILPKPFTQAELGSCVSHLVGQPSPGS